MSKVSQVREFVVPKRLVLQTVQSLQRAGSAGYESFVLWGGQLDDTAETLSFVEAYFPEQTTSASSDGLLVEVSGEALFRVNRAFYERGLILAGQVHSHPKDAYHSATDDAYPLMTLVGGLSGVVPDFARGGMRDFGRWAWYRLSGTGQWNPAGDETSFRLTE